MTPCHVTPRNTCAHLSCSAHAMAVGDIADVAALIRSLRTGEEAANLPTGCGDMFDVARPVAVSRAPGRLDVIGGIADYSGSLVLQMPISEGAFAAVQLGEAGQTGEARIRAVSLAHPAYEAPLSDLYAGVGGEPTSLTDLRAQLGKSEETKWAAYVVGVLGVLAHEPETREAVKNCAGCSILVASAVPEGKGVSSSASVEVATMMAALGALGVTIAPPERIALLCQRVENFVVGAPCGIMDQMASALGHKGKLLPLLCQPHAVQPPLRIPPQARFWGIDSGVRHSVGGSDYGTVRAATFMARAVLRKVLRERALSAASASPSPLALPAGVTHLEHLVEISPSLFAELAPELPLAMSGRDFLKAHGSHDDDATQVEPETIYDLRGCAAHPIHEHFRVSTFRSVLVSLHATADADANTTTAASRPLLEILGELMFASHASYSAVGLGSGATDSIVQLVRSLGPQSGLYGAKITGGGSGGTVCVLGDATAAAEASLQKVLADYTRLSGHTPHVFTGSSEGAIAFGHHLLNLSSEQQPSAGGKRKGRGD